MTKTGISPIVFLSFSCWLHLLSCVVVIYLLAASAQLCACHLAAGCICSVVWLPYLAARPDYSAYTRPVYLLFPCTFLCDVQCIYGLSKTP